MHDESEKYPYFPEINKYDLIYKNYYIVNNKPFFENKSENRYKYNMNTEASNPNKKYIQYKINEEEKNNHFFNSKDRFSNNIYNEYVNLNNTNNNNNFIIKKDYYDSIIKKKVNLLDEIEKEEKINNKTTSKIMHYKNTIQSNYKKIIKKNSRKSNQINKCKQRQFKNKNSNANFTDYNLKSYYPSPIPQKDLNINSNHNSLLRKENSQNNSYYTHSTKNNSLNNNNITLSRNNSINNHYNHYTSKSGIQLEIVRDYNYKKINNNKKKSNSYILLPNNECSLMFEGKKNKTNLNSKRNNINNQIDNNLGKNQICYASKNRAFNSLGYIDNSLSTNFIDKQSVNDNHTLSVNDNNQHSLVYNKKNNISYTFPCKYNKENNVNLSGENFMNEIYFKKINNYRSLGNKKQKKAFNRIVIPKNKDNITSNTINIDSDSSSKSREIKTQDNFKEKLDDFNIINELFDEKKILELKIASGEINENVEHKPNKHDKIASMSQKSEPVTIQSMSDSKILEIANYYLNEEETVDKIEIDDILSTKNNKSNVNIGEK